MLTDQAGFEPLPFTKFPTVPSTVPSPPVPKGYVEADRSRKLSGFNERMRQRSDFYRPSRVRFRVEASGPAYVFC